MSACEKTEVICPKCNAPQLFDDWIVVNVTSNPEMKARVMEGDLFTLTCSLCKEQTHIQKPLLYSDIEKNFMVHLLHGEEPDADMLDGFPQLSKVKLRYVDDEMQFYEKIRIFDDGIDDRIIEIEKLTLVDVVRESWAKEPLEIYYQGLSDYVQGGKQMGYYVVLEEGVRKITFPYPEKYKKSIRQFLQKLPDTSNELGRWLKVDPACAKAWLAVMNIEKLRPSASTIERVSTSAKRRPSATGIPRVYPSAKRRPSASGITRLSSSKKRRPSAASIARASSNPRRRRRRFKR